MPSAALRSYVCMSLSFVVDKRSLPVKPTWQQCQRPLQHLFQPTERLCCTDTEWLPARQCLESDASPASDRLPPTHRHLSHTSFTSHCIFVRFGFCCCCLAIKCTNCCWHFKAAASISSGCCRPPCACLCVLVVLLLLNTLLLLAVWSVTCLFCVSASFFAAFLCFISRILRLFNLSGSFTFFKSCVLLLLLHFNYYFQKPAAPTSRLFCHKYFCMKLLRF